MFHLINKQFPAGGVRAIHITQLYIINYQGQMLPTDTDEAFSAFLRKS